MAVLQQSSVDLLNLAPSVIARRLRRGEALRRNEIETKPGVVVHVYLRGLEAFLSESFPSSIARLPVLEEFFQETLASVAYYDATITRINSDTILIYFPENEGIPTSEMILTAITATRRMLIQSHTWFEANERILPQPLHMDIVVYHDTVQSVLVGNTRQTLLIGGAAFRDLRHNIPSKGTWTIWLHRQAFDQMDVVPPGEWVQQAFFQPDVEILDEFLRDFVAEIPKWRDMFEATVNRSILKSFVDERLVHYLLVERLHMDDQINPVVCLVVQYGSLQFDEAIEVDQWEKVLQQTYDLMQQFGGYTDFHYINPNAGEIIIFFGTPDAHANPWRRAVGCAHAMMRRREHSTRIGIASAPGLSAWVGTQQQRAYLVISQGIHAGRLLMDKTPFGNVTVDAATQSQAGDSFEWRHRPEHQAYFLVREEHYGNALQTRRRSHPPEPLLGYEAAQEQLTSLIEKARAGQGFVLEVVGASGSGKSAIIDHLVNAWIEQGGQGYLTIGPAHSPSAPYQLWLNIWQSLFQMRSSETLRNQRRQLAIYMQAVAPNHVQATRIFQNLMGLEAQEPAEINLLNPEARQRMVLEVLLLALRHKLFTSDKPLLLVFEHLDNLDTASRDLLIQLSFWLAELPIIICLEGDINIPESERLTLPNWSRETASRYLGEYSLILPADDIPPANARHYRSLAANFPRTVTRTTNLDQAGEHLVQSFNRPEREMLAQIAQWGMLFPPYALEGDWTVIESPDFIEELRHLGIIERFYDSSDILVWERFRNCSIRESALMFHSPAGLAEAQQQISNFIQNNEQGPARAAALAAQTDADTDPFAATQMHLIAGSHATRWGAYAEAFEHYRQAEQILGTHVGEQEGTALRTNLLLGQALLHEFKGEVEQGIADAQAALALADDDTLTHIRAQIQLVAFHHQSGQYDQAAALAEQTIEMVMTNQFTEFIAQVMWMRASSLHQLKREKEASRLLLKAIPYAQRSATPHLELSIMLDAVNAQLKNYQRDMAHEHMERLIEINEEVGDTALSQRVWYAFGRVQLLYGDASSAHEACQKALSLATPQAVDLSQLADMLTTRGMALCYSGHYDDAAPLFETAQSYLAQVNRSPLLVDVWRAGELLYDQGEFEQAQTIFERALASDELSSYMSVYAQLKQIAICLRQGQLDSAEEKLEQVSKLRYTHEPLWRWYSPVWYLRRGELALQRHQDQKAMLFASQSLGSVGTQSELRYLTLSYGLLAVSLYKIRGASDAVQDALNRAIRTGRRQARRLHEGQALQLTGNYVRSVSTRQTVRARSSGYLFEAKAIFGELGVKPAMMWRDLPPVFLNGD